MTRKVTGPHKRGDSLNQRFSEVPVYIGSVPKLASGEINPMWATTISVSVLASRIAKNGGILPKPKRTMRIATSSKGGFFTKEIEIEEEEEVVISEEDDKLEIYGAEKKVGRTRRKS